MVAASIETKKFAERIHAVALLAPLRDEELNTPRIVIETADISDGQLSVIQRGLRGLPLLRRKQLAVYEVQGRQKVTTRRNGRSK